MITQGFQNIPFLKGAPGDLKTGKNFLTNLATGKGSSFGNVFSKFMVSEDTGNPVDMLKNSGFFDFKEIKGGKENSLVNMLMKGIQTGDMVPGDVKVDAKGLKLFENLMKSLGFGEDTIATFMAGLTEDGDKTEISLSTLLMKTNKLLKSGETHDEMAMSATPYIETILSGMGVDPKEIEALLNSARSENGGVDLQNLIADLAKFAGAKSEDNTLEAIPVTSGNNQLLTGLGISAGGKEVFTLHDFIKGLEQLVNSKTGKKVSMDEPINVANKLGENILKTAEDGNGSKNVQTENHPLLNNHSFQKHRQMMEEGLNADQADAKKVVQLKPSETPFSVKEGVALFSEKNLAAALTKKSDDSQGHLFKAGVASDSIINKSDNQVFRLPVEKALPSYLTNQVGYKIVQAVNNGDSEIRFQIKPPEMGRLQISLEFNKNGMKIGILAENTATREMLMANSSELKSILADQGIRLEKVQVDVSGNFDQSMADARKESGQSGKRNKENNDKEKRYDQIAVNEPANVSDNIYLGPETGRLNLFA